MDCFQEGIYSDNSNMDNITDLRTGFTFASNMVSPKLIAALSMSIHLAVMLKNLGGGLIVFFNTL